MRADRAAFWKAVESWLWRWEREQSPSRHFQGREGWWVLLRGLGLVVLVAIAFAYPTPAVLLFVGVTTACLAVDILVANTAIVFVTRGPVNVLRSALLTYLAYLELAAAFAVAYAPLRNAFECQNVGPVEALHSSVVMMVTMGYADLKPARGAWALQALLTAQLVVGLYFLVALVGGVVGWLSVDTRRPRPRVLTVRAYQHLGRAHLLKGASRITRG